MLPHPLKLQRALRPLKRSVPAPFGQELDEAATAHRIARLGAAPQWWLPVLRPATERWLTLHLVHDTGPTMPIWRPLVRELHAALAQSGIFRTVELHRLETDGTVRRPGSQEAYADGRTVTLLISDCMGPQWRDGPAGSRWYATLRRWSARMPVAVVQPLPERLWRTTALPATTARLAAPGPAAPNSAYDVDSYAVEDLPARRAAPPRPGGLGALAGELVGAGRAGADSRARSACWAPPRLPRRSTNGAAATPNGSPPRSCCSASVPSPPRRPSGWPVISPSGAPSCPSCAWSTRRSRGTPSRSTSPR